MNTERVMTLLLWSTGILMVWEKLETSIHSYVQSERFSLLSFFIWTFGEQWAVTVACNMFIFHDYNEVQSV